MVLWLAAACVPRFVDIAGTAAGNAFQVGQPIPPVVLPDHTGADVELASFAGRLMLLDISTMWCGPCQTLAAEIPATVADYDADSFAYVTVLQEDEHGDPPDQEDLVRWVDVFSLTTPVLGDATEPRATGEAVIEGTFPALLLVDPDGVVFERIEVAEDAAVRAAIDDALETLL